MRHHVQGPLPLESFTKSMSAAGHYLIAAAPFYLIIAMATISRAASSWATRAGITTMRAVQVSAWGGPEQLVVQEGLPIPSPGPDQVLVKVMAAGVNPVETYIRQGTYATLPPLPWTPGNDGAGIVESVGNSSSGRLQVGQRVWLAGSISGTYAEYCLAKESQVQPLPETVSFLQGATLFGSYRTAHKALFGRIQTAPGSKVLIHGGSGAVGTAAIQLAKGRGCEVAGTAGTQAGMKIIESLGATSFNHRTQSYVEDIVQKFGKPDVIIEMLANVNLNADMDMLNRHGSIVIVGNRGSIDNVNMRKLMMSEGRIVGSLGGTPAENEAAILDINEGLTNGTVVPVVGPVFQFDRSENVAASHVEVIEHPHGSGGKVLLEMHNEQGTEPDDCPVAARGEEGFDVLKPSATSADTDAGNRKRGYSALLPSLSEKERLAHSLAQKKHRDNHKIKMDRLHEIVRTLVDLEDGRRSDIGRITKLDIYTCALGLAKGKTSDQIKQELINTRENKKAAGSDGEDRFKRLRAEEKEMLTQLQAVVTKSDKKLTKANALDDAVDFLENKYASKLAFTEV